MARDEFCAKSAVIREWNYSVIILNHYYDSGYVKQEFWVRARILITKEEKIRGAR